MDSVNTFSNRSGLAKVTVIVAVGICAYELCELLGIGFSFGSVVISCLASILFAPVFDLKRPFKWVGIVCLIGFSIALSACMTGFASGFVHGFGENFHPGNATSYAQAIGQE